uniref:NADH-ubiquinone oxidoreductase chain 2 n=1 Tax=Chrysomeloidea sp. 1 KM-2017 TaxID=2219295 RepID=A0A346RJN2_9CUCU|nr:NADH dehydrogenase subunit 2 [Chrysomeloidea sp. 1 KM-2017]
MTFFIFMITGTMITLSSYSWFGLWLGLEINLMSIIPLLTDTKNKFPAEAALKYFITQVIASLIFLFSSIMVMTKEEQISSMPMNLIMMMMYSSIFMKMGAAPFHAWFPEVLEGLNWMNCLIMLTWQKIAPMIILMNNFMLNKFIMMVIVSSLIISSILGLNQISMRKILAYSSINHIAWMISSMFQTKMIWFIYFTIYSLISIAIILLLNKNKILFISQMNIYKNNKLENLIISANLFSLAGLPPFIGFFPKWLTINSLIMQKMYFLTTILIMFTLISLYFYLRITFSNLTFSSSETSTKMNYLHNFTIMIFNILMILGLALVTLMMNSL